MAKDIYHYNFDRIVGPTHNYSGLSHGNVASAANKNTSSNPKQAALEGLNKMLLLAEYGVPQAVLPPNERPHIPTLKMLGYTGTDTEIYTQCIKSQPELLPFICTAADMYAANSATVTPSRDTLDGKLHLTPANLASKFHRAIENPFTYKLFKIIFADPNYFVVHPPLMNVRQYYDEGSANHTRFCKTEGSLGLHLFVYGFSSFKEHALVPTIFPPRQSLEASQAIARRHQLLHEHVIYAQQNPRAIDSGVFHNDVISVGNDSLFLYHEDSFVSTDLIIEQLQKYASDIFNQKLTEIKITNQELSLADAVSTYLFNSQIVTLPDNTMLLIAPKQCQDNPKTRALLEELQKNNNSAIKKVVYSQLEESMRNGGGPACLRLKITMNEAEHSSMLQGIIFNKVRYTQLKDWIEKHYRDHLTPSDLRDPQLVRENQTALDELTKILKLGSIYSFQKQSQD